MTVELYEVLYLIIGSGGAFLTLFVLTMRVNDLRILNLTRDAQGRKVNGWRRKLVWERVLSCFGWFTFNLLMVVAGVIALFNEPSPEPLTPVRLFWRMLFFGVVIFSTGLALFQGYIRQETAPLKKADGGLS